MRDVLRNQIVYVESSTVQENVTSALSNYDYVVIAIVLKQKIHR